MGRRVLEHLLDGVAGQLRGRQIAGPAHEHQLDVAAHLVQDALSDRRRRAHLVIVLRIVDVDLLREALHHGTLTHILQPRGTPGPLSRGLALVG